MSYIKAIKQENIDFDLIPKNILALKVHTPILIENHNFYKIDIEATVEWLPYKHTVLKRYNDFYKLKNELKRYFVSYISLPPFPPKFWRDLTSDELDKRRIGLQNFLYAIMSHPLLQKGGCRGKILKFLNISYEETLDF